MAGGRGLEKAVKAPKVSKKVAEVEEDGDDEGTDVQILDDKVFQIKLKSSKCKGHKFQGMILYALEDDIGMRQSGEGEDDTIVFHCAYFAFESQPLNSARD